MTETQVSVCSLCGDHSALQLSHVLPAFVYRRQRKTSGTGYIRFGEAPNRRVQDGIKIRLLCRMCEERLNRFETDFANNLFHPWNDNPRATIRYYDWFMKFCVSISWRVLVYFMSQVENGIVHLSIEQKIEARRALSHWSDVLLDTQPHPGRFEQHVILVDTISSHSVKNIAKNINRYFLRAVEMDLPANRDFASTMAKLGRFVIFGYIKPPAKKWTGTKVHVKTGTIGPRHYNLTDDVLEYFNYRASRHDRLSKQLSEQQQEKIERSVLSNLNRWVGSETHAAMLRDFEMFGIEAISRSSNARDGNKEDE